MRQFTRFIVYGALAGALVPLVILFVARFTPFANDVIFLIFWPTGFFLGGPVENMSAWDQLALLASTIGMNIVLYSVGGLICFLLFRRRGS